MVQLERLIDGTYHEITHVFTTVYPAGEDVRVLSVVARSLALRPSEAVEVAFIWSTRFRPVASVPRNALFLIR